MVRLGMSCQHWNIARASGISPYLGSRIAMMVRISFMLRHFLGIKLPDLVL